MQSAKKKKKKKTKKKKKKDKQQKKRTKAFNFGAFIDGSTAPLETVRGATSACFKMAISSHGGGRPERPQDYALRPGQEFFYHSSGCIVLTDHPGRRAVRGQSVPASPADSAQHAAFAATDFRQHRGPGDRAYPPPGPRARWLQWYSALRSRLYEAFFPPPISKTQLAPVSALLHDRIAKSYAARAGGEGHGALVNAASRSRPRAHLDVFGVPVSRPWHWSFAGSAAAAFRRSRPPARRAFEARGSRRRWSAAELHCEVITLIPHCTVTTRCVRHSSRVAADAWPWWPAGFLAAAVLAVGHRGGGGEWGGGGSLRGAAGGDRAGAAPLTDLLSAL